MLNLTRLVQRVDEDIELHSFDESYAQPLFSIVDHDRTYLRRWQNWPDSVLYLHDMQQLIQSSKQKMRYDDGFDMVILYRGQVAGKVGLVFIEWSESYAEIGYWLAQSFEGNGIMTRATRAIVHYALEEMGLETVKIRCAMGNIRSAAVAQRLGFEYEGVLPYKAYIHGELHRERVFSMSAQRWRERMIYHITTQDEWDAAQDAGEYTAPSLETQGFIHLSKKEQIVKVANAVYAGQKNLVLLVVSPDSFGSALRYEPPDTQVPAAHEEEELFPHIYGAIPLNAVTRVIDLPSNLDDTFSLPQDL